MEVENMLYAITEYAPLPVGTWLVVDKYETRQDMRDALKVAHELQGRDIWVGISGETRTRGARFYNGVWHAEY
jgi:hypothetical protein